MQEGEIIQLLNREVDQAQGYDSDVLAAQRTKALNYYNGKMAAAAKGRSQLVSHDVADVVNALMAQASEIYRSSVVEFDATSEEDEPQAQLESDLIRYMIETNDEWRTFDNASFDAFLQANGWIRVELATDENVERDKWEGQPLEAVMNITTPQAENEVIELEDMTENEDGTFDFTTVKTTTKQRLDITCVSPDVMLFSPASDQYDLQQLRFVGERKLYTVAELEEMGVSKDDAEAMTTITDNYWPAILAREGEFSETTNDEEGGKQPATVLKETFICYILIDQEGNGKVERRRIHYGGSKIISDDPYNYVPYVTGSPLPMPHRIQGYGMYDQQRCVQDAKTGILRQYMDNLDVMNKSRVGYIRGEVNVNELQEGRINGAVGMESRDSLWSLESNNIGMEAIQGLNYLDQVRTSRGGAALDMNNGDFQIAQSSAAAAVGELNAKEQMAGYYCKNLAHSLVKGTFLLAHKCMRENWSGPIGAKLRGKWTRTSPSDWQERDHARITVGMTTQERASRVQGLSALMAWQTEMIDKGYEGIITDRNKVYNAGADWIRAANLGPNPEEYLVDPASEEAKQAQQAKDQQQQQMQQQQEAMQQQQNQMAQMALQLQRQIEVMKDATDRWQTQMQTQYDYYKTNVDAEIQEAEMTSKGVLELNRQDQSSAAGE